MKNKKILENVGFEFFDLEGKRIDSMPEPFDFNVWLLGPYSPHEMAIFPTSVDKAPADVAKEDLYKVTMELHDAIYEDDSEIIDEAFMIGEYPLEKAAELARSLKCEFFYFIEWSEYRFLSLVDPVTMESEIIGHSRND